MIKYDQYKGISFFAVDLRWGITEEDIQNDRLVRLCLNEVDKCRPYFLGIIGERYGSTMTSVPDILLAEHPWISQKSEASYTELEITYHFLQNNDQTNTLFLFNDCVNDKVADPRLLRLKEFIRENVMDQVLEYDSLSAFGEMIVQQFSLWLDSNFGNTDVHGERERLYRRELLDKYVHNTEEECSISSCIEMADSSVLVYGEGPLGKTSLLNKISEGYLLFIGIVPAVILCACSLIFSITAEKRSAAAYVLALVMALVFSGIMIVYCSTAVTPELMDTILENSLTGENTQVSMTAATTGDNVQSVLILAAFSGVGAFIGNAIRKKRSTAVTVDDEYDN